MTAPLAEHVPVVVMCYVNLLMAHGLEDAPMMLRTHGVSGLIVPDLPAAEAGDLRAACDEADVALVPLVAPTTPPGEVEQIAREARGFVYVVSVTGVTGERAALPRSWARWWSGSAPPPAFPSRSASGSGRPTRSQRSVASRTA